MADDQMVYPGEVLDVLPNGHYKVRIKELEHEMQAYKGGKMKKYHISLLPGDWVDVEINQYDITKGRIVYRHKGNPYKQPGYDSNVIPTYKNMQPSRKRSA